MWVSVLPLNALCMCMVQRSEVRGSNAQVDWSGGEELLVPIHALPSVSCGVMCTVVCEVCKIISQDIHTHARMHTHTHFSHSFVISCSNRQK